MLLLKPCRDPTCFCLSTELIFMAKRRAETLTVLHDSPSKRCCRYLDSGDAQLRSVARTGVASPSPPPCLMPSMGSRCRKRPYHSENPSKQGNGEAVAATADLYYKTTQCDTRKHAADVLTVQTSGSFPERRSSSISRKDEKRQRGDCACPQSGVTQVNKVVSYWLNSRTVHRVNCVIPRNVH